MHTLKDDLQVVARDQKISVVRAAALEEEKRHRLIDDEPAQPARSHTALIVAFILILLGCAALLGVYITLPKTTTPSHPASQSLVFAEQTILFPVGDLPSADLKRTLAEVRTGNLTLGSIVHIVPTIGEGETARPVRTQEFLSTLGVTPPDDLLRTFRGDFFFGFHAADKNAPLFIIPVTSYERAFAGMLSWEKNMNGDLSPVFAAVPAMNMQGGTPGVRSFGDEVIRNYDVRALKDDNGQIILYYSFPSKDILIIAESPYTFTEILTRLRAQRLI